MTKQKLRVPKSAARQYTESIGLALILAIVMRSSFVQAYVIPSGSMEPTILVGDHIFVNKVAYGLRIPETIAGVPVPGLSSGKYLFHVAPIHRGDIIVFTAPYDRSIRSDQAGDRRAGGQSTSYRWSRMAQRRTDI